MKLVFNLTKNPDYDDNYLTIFGIDFCHWDRGAYRFDVDLFRIRRFTIWVLI